MTHHRPGFPISLVAPAAAFLALTASVGAGTLVELDATTLPAGPLAAWTNTGSLGGTFNKEVDTPSVALVAGVKGVTFDGTSDWYVGPTAPSSVTGNGTRSAIAWIYNPSVAVEETIVAWGRRGGGNGTNCSFTHGTHNIWGALGFWGDVADVSWLGAQETGAWTCLAFSYNSSTSTSTIYTNGAVSNTEINGPLNTWATSTSGGALPIVVGIQNQSGGTRDNGAVPASFTLAKLKVFDHVLTQADIVASYNADAIAFGRSPTAYIESFTASDTTIYRGDSVTLSWSVLGASSIAISPSVTIPPGATSVQISPTATTAYTLTATGPSGNTTRSVTVTVDPGSPVAISESVIATQDTALPITLTATDPNTPAGNLTWSVVSPPQHGSLTGTLPNATYTPSVGYLGPDSFTFRANDGLTDSNIATVAIIVDPPPAPPTSVIPTTPTVLTNTAAGSFVTQLTSQDPNHAETHTYQLVAGEGDTHNSWFTLSGSQLIAQHDFSGAAGTSVTVRVRSTDSTGRSVEQILIFPVATFTPNVVINEIHYNPANNTRTEFVELHNPTASPIDISGWQFTNGIAFVFPAGTVIAAGGFAVVAGNPSDFQTEYGFVPLGPFGGGLSSDGEKLDLRNGTGTLIDTVDYKPEFPWPIAAGSGDGPSMELIHPSLDNNLGGSWRSSVSTVNYPQISYVPPNSAGWRWRPGSTEASTPTTAWRLSGFVEDSSWQTYLAPIGYGSVSSASGTLSINTTISGMLNNYRCIFARKSFTINPGEIPSALTLRYCQDDGILVWINGVLADSKNVTETANPTINTTASNQGTEGIWYQKSITNASALLFEGTNTIAVQLINTTLGSSDLGFDLELIRVAGSNTLKPTPGASNTVLAASPPPQIRQVSHAPQQPLSTETVTITAKVTDPQGVGPVNLLYQVVQPGSFIPARFPRPMATVLANPAGERPVNPAFENVANWTTVAMRDDGAGGDAVAADNIYTAVLPAMNHRTLVRYRISATDLQANTVRVPYSDDPSLNFAYFVYNGVPDYVAASASVAPEGAGKVWPKELLTSLPVYHWLIRPEDMLTLQAYNASEQFPNDELDNTLAARRCEEWEGAFVYDGIVYDHVCTRLRGGNSRYGDNEGRFTYGKRHYKFAFNEGNLFQAKDQNGTPFPRKWPSLAINKMFGNKGGNGWGMPEEIGATLWSTFGVPAANTWWFHFRVIDGAEEAPDQYNGDFWGIQQVVEEYEKPFLDARGMTSGNLYKMSDWIWDAERQRRYQSPDMVRDGSEFNNIRDNLHGGQTAAWLQQYVNYDKWYRYSAVAEAIRHYDLFPYTDNLRHSLKNLAWYFEPVGTDPTRGVCTFLPYDWDASFGPNWNNGWEHANNALYGWDMTTSDGMPYVDKPEMKIAHRNVLREFRDLIWQTDQIDNLMDDRAAVISELSKADQDRWRNAPQASGTANDDTLVYKVQDMKNFCFVGWTGASGPTVGAGGRAAYLSTLADSADSGLLPVTPTISYTGAPNHPLNGLSFQCSAFSDPQGAGSFGAMAWRIGQIEDPTAPAYDPADEFVLEYTPVWESGVLTSYQSSVAVPVGAIKPGLTYRARVRMQDNSGRWSHWSPAYQFTATTPATVTDLQQNLVVSEINYHPLPPYTSAEQAATADKNDFEFIELRNISSTLTLDLSELSFSKGLIFSFAGSSVTSLPPGGYALVVRNLPAFQARYGTGLPVAGIYTGSLDNAGEEVELTATGVVVRNFTYDDASPWPVTPDGGGPSLTLTNPPANPDHSLAENWRASYVSGGSPGTVDTIATVTLDGLASTYNGTARIVTATTSPAGLAVDITYNGGASPPINAGDYAVVASVNDPIFTGTATGTLVVAKAAQSLTFDPPASVPADGPPIVLTGSSDADLTVSYQLLDGPGLLLGNTLYPNAAGNVIVRAAQAGSANYEAAIPQDRTILVTASWAGSAWQAAHFTPTEIANPAVSGNNADPDGDGLTNLLEYALKLNPKQRNSPSPLTLSEVVDAGQRYYAYSFRRRVPDLGISYQPEIATDLTGWSSAPANLVPFGPPSDNGDGTETVTYRSTVPSANATQQFFRLRVVVP